ncbi:hypothetical protein JCM19000A_10900 [Silvimonas sp. JCM 19000]
MDKDVRADRSQFGQLTPLDVALQEQALPRRWAQTDLAVELLADGLRLDEIVRRLRDVFMPGTLKDEVQMLSAHDTALRRFESLRYQAERGQLSAAQREELAAYAQTASLETRNEIAAALAGAPPGSSDVNIG